MLYRIHRVGRFLNIQGGKYAQYDISFDLSKLVKLQLWDNAAGPQLRIELQSCCRAKEEEKMDIRIYDEKAAELRKLKHSIMEEHSRTPLQVEMK